MFLSKIDHIINVKNFVVIILFTFMSVMWNIFD